MHSRTANPYILAIIAAISAPVFPALAGTLTTLYSFISGGTHNGSQLNDCNYTRH